MPSTDTLPSQASRVVGLATVKLDMLNISHGEAGANDLQTAEFSRPVCGMMHIKEPLLLIGKSSSCGGSGFPLSLYEWSFTICPTPYNRK